MQNKSFIEKINFLFLISMLFLFTFTKFLHAKNLNGDYNFLYTSKVNYKKGDIIKVYISEKLMAIQNNKTDLSKNAGLGGGFSLAGILGSSSADGEVNIKETHRGEGKAEQSGKVSGVISVKVVNIRKNGILVVEGEKLIEINGSIQKLVLKGEVNPLDIRADNTVYSSDISNMNLVYSGEGALGNKARVGLLSQILDLLWIF